MPYKLFNGSTNIVSDLIAKRRKEKSGKRNLAFVQYIVISVLAGLGGCLVIYFICACGGAPLLLKLFLKSLCSSGAPPPAQIK